MAQIDIRPGVRQLDITYAATCDEIFNLGAGELLRDSFTWLSEEELEKHPDASLEVKKYGSLALTLARKYHRSS